MNEKAIVSITFSLFITCSVNADELVPATSEDVSTFERMVTTQALSEAKALNPRPDRPSKELVKEAVRENTKLRKETFGLVVSTEAKRLKESSTENKKEMGQWVSEQRRKDRQNGISNGLSRSISNGNSNSRDSLSGDSASSEARRAAPERKSHERESDRRERRGPPKK